MTEALLLLSAGSLLTVSMATLIIAILALRHAQRYVQLAEERMEQLREEQARLLMLAREELQRSHEGPEWERRQEIQQEEHRRPEHITRREAERKIEQVRRELLGLPQEPQESTSPLAEGSPEDDNMARARGSLMEKAWPTQKKAPRSGTSRAQTSSKSAQGSPEDKKLLLGRHSLAVWHPHPDDDVNPRSE